MNKIDINHLKKLESEGWVKHQTHPTLPLMIWNYTPKTQWESKWDEFTIMCRGLVTDTNGNIVAHPLKKFFNYSELAAWNKVPDISKGYTIYAKMDGSYIQIFNYKGEWVVSSRGSFNSDHAKYAWNILHENLTPEGGDPYYVMNPDCNYIFELIHPDTRIVVDYGNKKDLVLLAVIERDGKEHPIEPYFGRFTVTNQIDYDVNDFSELSETIPDEAEGYVIKFGTGERMKIKGEEYVRLHRIVTQTSSYDIWNALKYGHSMDEFMDRVPDEWMNWVYQTVGKMYMDYLKIVQQVDRDWGYGGETHNLYYQDWESGKWIKNPEISRKQVADYINTCQHPGLMFARLDNNDFSQNVWDMVKPQHEKGFSI